MYTAYLVDDEEIILDEFVKTIPWMDNGFEVIGYNTNPGKAIVEIVSMKPDVVFSDLKMLEMDGNELIARLRDEGVTSEFVMISAYDSFENVRTFFQQSGFDYVLKPVQQDDIQMVLEKLCLRLAGKNPQNRESDIQDDSSSTDNLSFNGMLKYIDENFSNKITLDVLAKQFGYSKNYICNLFSKYYNSSLTCYLTQKRMALSRELLKDGDRLLKDIAHECGYSEYVQFYKVFKEHYGISPKEMIELLREET